MQTSGRCIRNINRSCNPKFLYPEYSPGIQNHQQQDDCGVTKLNTAQERKQQEKLIKYFLQV